MQCLQCRRARGKKEEVTGAETMSSSPLLSLTLSPILAHFFPLFSRPSRIFFIVLNFCACTLFAFSATLAGIMPPGSVAMLKVTFVLVSVSGSATHPKPWIFPRTYSFVGAPFACVIARPPVTNTPASLWKSFRSFGTAEQNSGHFSPCFAKLSGWTSDELICDTKSRAVMNITGALKHVYTARDPSAYSSSSFTLSSSGSYSFAVSVSVMKVANFCTGTFITPDTLTSTVGHHPTCAFSYSTPSPCDTVTHPSFCVKMRSASVRHGCTSPSFSAATGAGASSSGSAPAAGPLEAPPALPPAPAVPASAPPPPVRRAMRAAGSTTLYSFG
eukprot:Rhum_TRINITY_DN7937_c0_g1::Rhum_TRINITY_DN7937_c0_g1_i1::g.25051::m.25051